MKHFAISLQYLQEYGVIICNSCQHAVLPANIQGHVKKDHKEVSEYVRHRIVGYITELESVAYTVHEIKYPNEPIAPIPVLPVFHDGFGCQWRD